MPRRFYYHVKPFVPWGVRMAVRRWYARRTLKRVQDAWPIFPGSDHPPAGWRGWPDGKQLAFVLTHDVEGKEGLAKCRQLMELEMDLGFRSAYNFIPEGSYSVSADLRGELVSNGFEVGVHDLRHDGHLFSDRVSFRRSAGHINRHLKEWGATGFRSGFMLRNLEWMHDLDIAYDSSTFDCDPFEPQPEGLGSIFPLWMSDGNGGGYAELPYTLPQDSTLFLLLKQKAIDLWVRKLDWVAKSGGMVLVNVHPDYLRFPGEPHSPRTYPAEFYRQLLQHIRDHYADTCWRALPREVAWFVASTRPTKAQRIRRRVCMVTHSFYENDNRVMRYAEALAARGDEVDVVALRRGPDVPATETICGVNVFRVQTRKGKKEQSKLSYLLPLMRFLFTSGWWITRSQVRRPYDLVHVHNIPDFLVFAALYPRLAGARVILDIHDIVPEFFGSKFAAGKGSLAILALKLVERKSAAMAHHVILANHLWLDTYVSRSAPAGKCSVFINNVDTKVFYPRPRTRKDDRLIVLFPGGLQWHQGLDIAIRAFPEVIGKIPNAELHFYGDGNMKPELIKLAHDLGLDDKVKFFEPLRVREIAEVMANANLGIVPKRADSFGNEAYSTKIMEFMSLGVPVVVSATKIDRYYFNESVVRFFESGNHQAMAQAMCQVLLDAELRRELVAQARKFAVLHGWESRRNDYLQLVDGLCPAEQYVTTQHSAVPRRADAMVSGTLP